MSSGKIKKLTALALSLAVIGTTLFSGNLAVGAETLDETPVADTAAESVIPAASEKELVTESVSTDTAAAETTNTETVNTAAAGTMAAAEETVTAAAKNDTAEPDVSGSALDSSTNAQNIRTLTYSDGQVQVTATETQAGILPEDAQIVVQKVVDEATCEKAFNAVGSAVDAKGTGLISMAAYDVTFYSNGQKIEPDGNVNVQINFLSDVQLEGASVNGNDTTLYHLLDNDAVAEQVNNATIETDESEKLNSLDFTNDSFSVYVAATEGSEITGDVIYPETVSLLKAAGLVNDSGTDSGLELSKSAEANSDGTYTLSLDTYATGSSKTVSKPTDIVLVLDQSGSMSQNITTYSYTKVYNVNTLSDYYIMTDDGSYESVWYYGGGQGYQAGWYISYTSTLVYPYTNADGSALGSPAYQFYSRASSTKSKLDSLKDAVKSFITVVQEASETYDVNNRIAIVGFAMGDSNQYPAYYNTEIFVGSTGYQYNGATISSKYHSALQDTSNSTELQNLQDSVSKLDAYGCTRADLGMLMANNILSAYSKDSGDSDRNKVVVMFTDGEPNNYSGFSESVASATIQQANTTKTSYNATVYSVGVVDSLDPTQDPAAYDSSRMNKYMQYVSSNYPNAESLTKAGTGGDYTAGYFLSATTSDELKEIFDNISHSSTEVSTELDDDSYVKDYITDSFVPISASAGSGYKVFTEDYAGNGTWTNKQEYTAAQYASDVAYDSASNAITVSGFSYKDNYVMDANTISGATLHGKRLVIEITVRTIDGFIGGNDVPTNTASSGVFDKNGTSIDTFDVPDVDPALAFDFTSYDSSIYVTSSWSDVMKFFDNIETEGIQYQNDVNASKAVTTYTIDGKRNAYADVAYTVKNSSGTVIGTYTIASGQTSGTWDPSGFAVDTTTLTSDTSYTITATVTPSTAGVQTSLKTNTKTSTIHVFRPQLTYNDETLFYGETSETMADHIDLTGWKCDSESAELPSGTAPTLTYEMLNTMNTSTAYTGNDTVTPDTDINVTVSKIKIGDTNIKGCSFITPSSCTNGTHAEGRDFTIHVVKGELDLTKIIDKQYTKISQINANESFVFKIQQYGVNADGSKGALTATFYETIAFDANGSVTSGNSVIKGLEKGYYTVTEESEWTPKYTLKETSDNYSGNGSEGAELYIGKLIKASTNGSKPEYYGLDQTYTAVASGDAATVSFKNCVKDKSVWSWLSDAASAVNQFLQ